MIGQKHLSLDNYLPLETTPDFCAGYQKRISNAHSAHAVPRSTTSSPFGAILSHATVSSSTPHTARTRSCRRRADYENSSLQLGSPGLRLSLVCFRAGTLQDPDPLEHRLEEAPSEEVRLTLLVLPGGLPASPHHLRLACFVVGRPVLLLIFDAAVLCA